MVNWWIVIAVCVAANVVFFIGGLRRAKWAQPPSEWKPKRLEDLD